MNDEIDLWVKANTYYLISFTAPSDQVSTRKTVLVVEQWP
jgi:hypothetical protein